MSEYIALIHKEVASDFGVSFPDFPGCVTAGTDLDDAQRMAAEALELHVRGMIEDGEVIPAPSSLTTIMDDPANRDGVAILIKLPVKARSLRVNVTFAEDLLQEIDRKAEEQGYTRSGFLAAAAKRMMQDA